MYVVVDVYNICRPHEISLIFVFFFSSFKTNLPIIKLKALAVHIDVLFTVGYACMPKVQF